MSQHPQGLDDPRYASHAWARFRRIMGAIGAAAMALALSIVGALWLWEGPLPWIFFGLIIFGVWGTIMMAALLMGLVFLSSGSGHDEQVEDRVSKEVLGEDEN